MSKIFSLDVDKREIIGKKVKRLRAIGHVPAVVYGPEQDPVHISIDWSNLRTVMRDAGGTNLVELKLGDEVYTTLIRDVDRDPIDYHIVRHVDFYAVNLKEKLVTSVPVVLLNEDEANMRLEGRVILETSSIEVESLPTVIPSEIAIDTSALKEMGDQITIADLPAIEGVDYAMDDETVIVRTEYITQMVEEEEEEGEEDLEITEDMEPEVISRRREDEDFEEE